MVSVVIPAYNNPVEVDILLTSIALRCLQANPFEVIVVDDGSVNDGLRDVCARYPFVRFIRLPNNQGAAIARNTGANAALHHLLLFLDSDMVVLNDVIDQAIKLFQDPQIEAAVGAVSAESLNSGHFRRFWALVKAFSLPSGPYSSTFYPMIGVIRKDVFQQLDGFNGKIKGASIEDYEFSLRLEAYGHRVHYAPALLVGTHYKNIFKSLSQSFSRATKWVLLFWERRRFDNHTTTGAQAATAVCGTCLLGTLVLWCAGYGSPLLSVGLLGLYLYLNSRFLRYVGSTAGFWFIPIAVFFHSILSCVVTIGAARGAVQLLLGPERCRALLYR